MKKESKKDVKVIDKGIYVMLMRKERKGSLCMNYLLPAALALASLTRSHTLISLSLEHVAKRFP